MKAIDIATTNHVSAEDIITICKDLGIPCDSMDLDISEKNVFLIERKIGTIKEQRAKATRELLEKKNEHVEAKGTKIKLKRRVHVSKELIKEKGEEEARKHKEEEEQPEQSFQKPEIKEAVADKEKKAETAHKPDFKKTGPKKDFHPQNHRPRTDSGNKRFGDQRSRDHSAQPGRYAQGQRPSSAGQRPGPGTGRPHPEKRNDMGLPFAKGLGGEEKKDTEIVSEKDVLAKRKKLKEKEKEKDTKKKLYKEKAEKSEKDIYVRKKKPQQRVEEVEKISVAPKYIEITESIGVGDLAKKLNIKASEVISKLMKLGMMATINQVIDAETAEILASEYGTVVKVVSLFEETVIRQNEIDKPEDWGKRPPIVTVMGHVDHGKTKLLDAVRETNVVDGEFGGITQHIGAYMVRVGDNHISFIDTPGHEAFTTMRARGASVTDIVVLVVAANDGVMPQTIEAINHAKAAKVPIIVAINKIDLPDINLAKIKQDLVNYELIPEEWGGSTLYSEVSAKKKINIDKLLELILIQAEMLELKANPKLYARGAVIESRIDPGRGPVATILVQNGTLKIGDPFVVGIYGGKVRALFNDQGTTVYEAGPSTPVEVLGLSGVPSAGDPFQVVESEKYSKQISQKRLDLRRLESAKKVRKVTLENLNEMIKGGEVQELAVIIKADVDGSVQALKESLEKLSTSEIRVKVIHAATGGINESDVMLASASNALIIGYHSRPSARVSDLAEKEKVSIKFFNIIFEVTNSVKAAMEGMLSPEIKEEIVGTGEIKQVFKISKLGTIAGSLLLTGKLQRKNKVRLIRNGVVIFDGQLKSLKRFKDDVSEVEAGQECGFGVEDFNDIKEGDTFEAYRTIEISKTLDG